jgi:hypothetical protein
MLFFIYTNKNMSIKNTNSKQNKKESEIIQYLEDENEKLQKELLECSKSPWENIDLLKLDAVSNKVIWSANLSTDQRSIELIDMMPRIVEKRKSADETIVKAARMLYCDACTSLDTNDKVIDFLWANNFTDPFESVVLSIKICVLSSESHKIYKNKQFSYIENGANNSIMTEFIMTGNILNWLLFIKSTRVNHMYTLSEAICKVIKPRIPSTFTTFIDYHVDNWNFSRSILILANDELYQNMLSLYTDPYGEEEEDDEEVQ